MDENCERADWNRRGLRSQRSMKGDGRKPRRNTVNEWMWLGTRQIRDTVKIRGGKNRSDAKETKNASTYTGNLPEK